MSESTFRYRLALLGLVVFTALGLAACGQPVAAESAPAEDPAATEAGAAEQATLRIVPANEVCMVNNTFFGREQIAVEVDGRTYYGCCEMCERALAEHAEARTAIDPVTGNEVDKATAVIGARPDGTVVYFESEESLHSFAE